MQFKTKDTGLLLRMTFNDGTKRSFRQSAPSLLIMPVYLDY
jgi:hypothetical protein